MTTDDRAPPQTDVVANIAYATARAQENTGATSVALTDCKPLQEHLKKTGESNAEAFEWHITKLPEDQIVPARAVREISMALLTDVLRLRQRNKTWSDDQIRDAVMLDHAEYNQLSRTHPRLVLLLTGSECTPRKLHHVLDLIELRATHERAAHLSLEEKQLQVSTYFQNNFVRVAEPGEEERAISDGTGLRGTIVRGVGPGPGPGPGPRT